MAARYTIHLLLIGTLLPCICGGPSVIPLMEYGVVFKPGRVISTADTNHVLQTFRIPIPLDEPPALDGSLLASCKKLRRGAHDIGTIDPCHILMDHIEWSKVTLRSLADTKARLLDTLRTIVPDVTARRHRRDARSTSTLPPILSEVDRLALLTGDDIELSGLDDHTATFSAVSDHAFVYFGMARNVDVQRLRKDFHVLVNKYNAFTDLVGHMANITDLHLLAMDRQINDLIDDRDRFLQRVSNATGMLFNRSITARDRLDDVGLLASLSQVLEQRVTAAILHYLDHINHLQLMVVEARLMRRHKLSQVLISPLDIERAVLEAGRYLRKRLPRFSVAFRDSAYYYENSFVTCSRTNDTLLVSMTIPVVSDEHLFTIYRVLSFPVPVRVFNTSTVDATLITDLPTEVAISFNAQYLIPQPVVDWGLCYGDTITVCPDIPLMGKTTDRTCIAALLRNDTNDIRALCRMDYIVNPVFPSMAVDLGRSRVLVVGRASQGHVLCGNKPPVPATIFMYAVVVLGCECAFKTTDAWIPYRISDCGQERLQSAVVFVKNNMITGLLDRGGWRRSPLQGRLVEQLRVHPVPTMLHTSMVTKARRSNSSFHIDLSRLVHKIQHNKVDVDNDFATPEEPDTSAMDHWGRIFRGQSWLNSFGMTILVVLVVVALASCCCYKFRSNVAGLWLMSQNPVVSATDLPMPGPPLVAQPDPGAACAITIIILLILVGFFMILSIVLYCKRARRLADRLPDGLYLQFASPAVSEVVNIGQATAPNDHLYVALSPEPLLQDITVNQFWFTHMATPIWGRQVIRAAAMGGAPDVPLTLPESFPISANLSRALRGRRHKGHIQVRLLRYSSGLATVVPFGIPRMTFDGWRPIGRRVDDDMGPPPSHGIPRPTSPDGMAARRLPEIPTERKPAASAAAVDSWDTKVHEYSDVLPAGAVAAHRGAYMQPTV